jgi:DNA-binding transcriptional regulator YdaS (Cro superfamily)
MNALQSAIELAGGKARLAKIIGAYPQLVDKWQSRGRNVPARWAIEIEKHTGISVEDLCPDADWEFIRGTEKRGKAPGDQQS